MEEQKNGYRPLQKMFMAVPPSYDFLNRLLTFRFDEKWRKQAAYECLKNKPSKILDLCCGTGDLVLRMRSIADDQVNITALDYSEPMLRVAKEKADKKKLNGIEFIHGDASKMPFPDDYFDSIGIAFAFRNLTFRNPDSDKFLNEILRVLRPGGRFVIVETSQPENRMIRKLFHLYMRWITGPAGGLMSGHKGAYKYLAYSACNYYDKDQLCALLAKSGFSIAISRMLLGGIAGLYIAVK